MLAIYLEIKSYYVSFGGIVNYGSADSGSWGGGQMSRIFTSMTNPLIR